MIHLDEHDNLLTRKAARAIRDAIAQAHMPVAVAKRISVLATRHRNQGKQAAKKRYPFRGICEASGQPLHKSDAVLDECEPEKGYLGVVHK